VVSEAVEQLVLFVAVVGLAAVGVGVVVSAGFGVSDAVEESAADQARQFDTAVTVVSDRRVGVYDNATGDLTLLVKNVGRRTLPATPGAVDLLVDGQFVPVDGVTVVDGADWRPGGVARVTADLAPETRPDRVVVSVGTADARGLLELAAPPDDADTVSPPDGTVAVTNATTDELVLVNDSGARNFGETAAATGPVTAGFGDAVYAAPYVTDVGSGRQVFVAEADGTTRRLSNATVVGGPTRLAVAAWTVAERSVYFPDTNGRIHRVTAAGSETLVTASLNNGVSAVAGAADLDGDGDEEFAYVDGSQELRYLAAPSDTTGEKLADGTGVGASNGVGLGEPADFDGDGLARVPIVDGSNNLLLADETGPEQTLVDGTDAAAPEKAPLATVDWDGDGTPEVVYLAVDGRLLYVDDVATSPTVRPTDATVTAGADTGAT
jgi:archaellum component FlaG (FlaF/FlaG flagellin family)